MCIRDRLVVDPGHQVAAQLLTRGHRRLVVDQQGPPGRLRGELDLAGPLQGDEPPGRRVHRVADRQQPVVAQHERLAGTEGGGDAAALVGVDGDAGVGVVQGVVLVEGAALLGDGVQEVAQRGEGAAVHRVTVGDRDDVGAGGVHLGVHGEGRLVDVVAALDDLAVGVGEDQVAHGDVFEGHPERIDPEAVAVLRVAGGDVPRDTVLEAEPPEDPQGAREPFLAVPAFLVDRVVHRRHGEPEPVGGERLGWSGPGFGRPVHLSSSTGLLTWRKLPSVRAGEQR